MDFDFQESVAKVWKMQGVLEVDFGKLAETHVSAVEEVAEKVNLKTDMERFILAYGGFFIPPSDFRFFPYGKTEVSQEMIPKTKMAMASDLEVLQERSACKVGIKAFLAHE